MLCNRIHVFCVVFFLQELDEEMSANESLSDSDVDHTNSNGFLTASKKGKSPNHYGNKFNDSSSEDNQISFSYSSDEEFLPDMIKKKKPPSSSKKKPTFPLSPSNKSRPLSQPSSPSKTPKVKSAARNSLASSHKERNIKTLGNSTPENMCDTTEQSRAFTEDTPHSPHAHTPSLHSSQLQPSQPHRRFENKKKDDLFSLEKKRRRLSSMNTLRKSLTPHTPDVGDTKILQMPLLASQGKTMKNNTVKTPRINSASSSESDVVPDPKTLSTANSKRKLSSILSSSENESTSLTIKQVSPTTEKTNDKQKPPLPLWKDDGMLNSSSSEHSDNETTLEPKNNIVDRMKSIFSDSESEDEMRSKKVKKPSPKPMIQKHSKIDKVARKRQVFSDSSSSEDESEPVKPVKGLPPSSKGNPHNEKGIPNTKPKSIHVQQQHHHKSPELGSKRPLDPHRDDDSTAKKLRLVDIDFTGGKMRSALSQTKSTSKLTPLKKLRLQSQKNHHRPIQLHRTKSSDTKERRTDPKTTSPEKTSKHTVPTKDGHHRKNDSFKKTHDSSKRAHDTTKKSHDTGKTLFAHKNAILAAKFPQKRNLVSEHS